MVSVPMDRHRAIRSAGVGPTGPTLAVFVFVGHFSEHFVEFEKYT